jgi:hypothetical protein
MPQVHLCPGTVDVGQLVKRFEGQLARFVKEKIRVLQILIMALVEVGKGYPKFR